MNNVMAVRNRIKEYVESLGITPYKFAQKTTVARNTVYNLCNKPEQIPDPSVMDKIYKAYPDVQPNDLIAFVADDEPVAA